MSIQTSSLLKITEIPLSQIKRPIPPVLDYGKIDAMVSTLSGIPAASRTCTLEEAIDLQGQLPPIDVMCIVEDGVRHYFAFGGCHRFQAYGRMGPDTLVRCKIIPATRSQLKLYLGSSVDAMFGA